MTELAVAPPVLDSAALTATEPPERRGLGRDGVRLLVATPAGIWHRRFAKLADILAPGDLLVVNDSATVAAEIDGMRRAGPVVVHAATELDDGDWVVELRTAPDGRHPVLDAEPGEMVDLPDAVALTLRAPYPRTRGRPGRPRTRLWRAQVHGDHLRTALEHHGRPIAYGYLAGRFPLADYQTVFGVWPGSAEMASAARPFTPALVTRLVAAGIPIATVTLHTGVSSQEYDEPPQAERFAVGEATARLVNATRTGGGRVIAVGTTVTRALESATDGDGRVITAAGWTNRVVTPDHPPRVVDGLVTGWHDPEASHLQLVRAVAGDTLTRRAYAAAYAERYRWHEFGDSGLLLPGRPDRPG